MKTNVKTLKDTSIEYDSDNYVVSTVSADVFKAEYVQITKEFGFEAGHFVPNHPKRCKYVHGHSYKLFVTIGGLINESGMVMDFGDLSDIVNGIIDKFDHGFLNDYFQNPTAEIMAVYLRNTIESLLPEGVHCDEIKLYETQKCCAISQRRITDV